jgi:hypothetical protein
MIALGPNSKITAPTSSRSAVRAMFDALGATRVSPDAAMDLYSTGSGSLGFVFVADSEALTAAQMRVAPWLELVVEDPARAAAALDAAGVSRLEYTDREHVYFVAPGGLVFRLAARP